MLLVLLLPSYLIACEESVPYFWNCSFTVEDTDCHASAIGSRDEEWDGSDSAILVIIGGDSVGWSLEMLEDGKIRLFPFAYVRMSESWNDISIEYTGLPLIVYNCESGTIKIAHEDLSAIDRSKYASTCVLISTLVEDHLKEARRGQSNFRMGKKSRHVARSR